jgi:hypothetical protein
LECAVPDRDTTEFQQLPWYDNNDYLENFLDSIDYPSNNMRIIGADRVRYHIPIKFWVYRNSAGVGGPTLLQLQNYIDNLNRLYNIDNNTYIGFYMKCDVGFINDNDHLEVGDVEAWGLAQGHKEAGAINVHIVDELKSATGVAYRARLFGLDAIFLDADTYIRPDLVSTLPHEVGHYLELDHTHQYKSWNSKCLTECIDRNRTWPPFNLCISSRLRSKKVCESTGDGLRDTPADHNLRNNNSCNYIVTGETDPWGDHYDTPPTGSLTPNPRNILSYNRQRGCRDEFTRLQIAVMLHSVVRGKSSGNEQKWKDAKAEYDEYEPDNNSVNADPILINEIQERNFHQQFEGNNFWFQCDEDWARFVPTCSGTFTINTSAITGRNNANTRLTLFNAGLTQLAQNDNISSSNQYSQISFSLTAGQTYFIRIENILAYPGAYNTGYYNLRVILQGVDPSSYHIGGSSNVCSSPETYVVNNLPSGSSVTWSASPQGLVQFSCTTCPQTTISAVGSGTIILSAAVTSPCGSSTVTKNISVGLPTGIGIVQYNNMEFCDGVSSFKVLISNPASLYPYSGSLAVSAGSLPVTWSLAPNTSSTNWSWYVSNNTLYVSTKQSNLNIVLRATATNSCGSTFKDYYFSSGECLAMAQSVDTQEENLELTLSPNPVTSSFEVSLKEKSTGAAVPIKEIIIQNKFGIIVKRLKFDDKSKTQRANMQQLPTDVYVVQVFDGKQWASRKIMKQ